eukprot:4593420-Prymnesium_polylepis.1
MAHFAAALLLSVVEDAKHHHGVQLCSAARSQHHCCGDGICGGAEDLKNCKNGPLELRPQHSRT